MHDGCAEAASRAARRAGLDEETTHVVARDDAVGRVHVGLEDATEQLVLDLAGFPILVRDREDRAVELEQLETALRALLVLGHVPFAVPENRELAPAAPEVRAANLSFVLREHGRGPGSERRLNRIATQLLLDELEDGACHG